MTDSKDCGSADRRVLRTLEQYFGTEIHEEHPLLEQVETRHLAGGDWLMHQGDSGNSLYFLVRGRLQAWARGADGREKGRFLNEIVPGDSVGELSLLTGAPRTVGIQAIRDSLLIRIDREAFDSLAQEHPTLALKLASNVAALLQSSNARAKSSTRNLKAICLLPLDETPRTAEFCSELASQLAEVGNTLSLSADSLGESGAPIHSVGEGEEIPGGLVNWLHDQEDARRFVLYRCSADNATWSRFVLRQSDMVVFVGDASQSPDPRRWELELDESSGAAIARRLLVLLQPASSTPIHGTSGWLAARQVDFHVHVRADQPDDIRRVTRIVSGNALGLVLAGGAARGFAHLGVHRAMRELGLPVDWIGGTSIGAIMAATIACPISDEESLQLARSSFVEGKPFSDFTIPMMSLIRGRRMDRLLREHLDFQIEDLPIPFYCVSCNLDTGSTNLHEHGDLPHALRASAALPGIIPPAIVNRRLTIDGAVVNNLPVDVMQAKPVSRILAVDLSSVAPVEVDYDDVPSPWAIFRGRYLPFSRRYRVPALSTIMLKATLLGTQERVNEQGRKADLLLKPPVRRYGMTEVKSFEQIVEAGYQHAREELTRWLENTG
ncbi:MAG: cyclic nucleotide-binding domain-containing protein [Xanthomonadales bacterium]|nr:cyclic nucleotide-binding domain-containing protein [Xanthomonadales bacterium]